MSRRKQTTEPEITITPELIRRVSRETGARGPRKQRQEMGTEAFRNRLREIGRLGGLAARGKSGRKKKDAPTP